MPHIITGLFDTWQQSERSLGDCIAVSADTDTADANRLRNALRARGAAEIGNARPGA